MDPILIGFLVYLAIMLVAGALTYRLNKTQEDFLLAGRRLNVWVATFSERASGESAWLLLGLPAAAYAVGLLEFWTALGSIAGIFFAWWAVAEGLRKETDRLGALTLTEYLCVRFGDQARAIRSVATLVVVFFYSFYLAAQFNGAGKVLNITFDIPHFWGITIGATIIVAYTMMGGFFAVAWTDLLQAIIMLGTLVILPIVAFNELSAQGSNLETIFAAQPKLSSFTGGKTGIAAFAAVVGGLSWGLGYCGQPHTVTRFMSIRDPATIKRGRVIAFFWAVPAFAGAIAIGIYAVGLLPADTFCTGPKASELLAAGKCLDKEQLMPLMATKLLPGWLAGIFISGAVAAMMSTADSQLLVGTSAIAEDLIHRGLGIKLSHAKMVLVSRAVTIGLGLAGFVLALTSKELIFSLVSYAWSGLGASFGPAILFTLHYRKTSGRGILWGMITGALTTIIWSNIDALDSFITARVVSFAFAALAIWLGSMGNKASAPA